MFQTCILLCDRTEEVAEDIALLVEVRVLQICTADIGRGKIANILTRLRFFERERHQTFAFWYILLGETAQLIKNVLQGAAHSKQRSHTKKGCEVANNVLHFHLWEQPLKRADV